MRRDIASRHPAQRSIAPKEIDTKGAYFHTDTYFANSDSR
jgi:hypothetical protein